MTGRLRRMLGWLVVAAPLGWACRDPVELRPSDTRQDPAADSAAVDLLERVARPFGDLARCQVEHRGVFLDLGDAGSQARRSFRLAPFGDLALSDAGEQGGTHFLGHRAHYDFWLDEPVRGLQLTLRAQGGRARFLHVVLDDWALGRTRLDPTEFRTLNLTPLKKRLEPGPHRVHLRWSHARGGEGPLATVQWMFLGEPGKFTTDYPLPRGSALRADVAIGGRPLPSWVLQAPGRLACTLHAAAGSRVALSLGYRGAGSGVARVVARKGDLPPVVLSERRIEGGDQAAWAPLDLPLDRVGPGVMRIDLEVVSDGPRGQVVFGDPKIVRRAPRVTPTRTRLAIVLVASGLHRELVPPFPSARRLPHLAALQSTSVRFPAHRAPSASTVSTLASLLTGLSPLSHGLRTPKAQLPQHVPTLASRLERQSGESALFSGVPASHEAFGLHRGFTHFEAYSPVSDVAATQPLDSGRQWIEERLDADSRPARLLVMHARGAHPPWDLTQEEVARLEPREYHGVLEARRGGIILSTVRSRRRRSQRRLSTHDWVRLRALQRAALEKQDTALGELEAALSRRGAWRDALVVFVGDLAAGDPPVAPFGRPRALTEDRLVTPLWIKFPGQTAPAVVSETVGVEDVARTIADALGLETDARDLATVNLERLSRGDRPPLVRGHLATRGPEYALRWGQWLLRGSSPGAPRLCNVAVDPTCAGDVQEQHPLVAEAIWRETFARHQSAFALDGTGGSAAPALIDDATAAALRVWGD